MSHAWAVTSVLGASGRSLVSFYPSLGHTGSVPSFSFLLVSSASPRIIVLHQRERWVRWACIIKLIMSPCLSPTFWVAQCCFSSYPWHVGDRLLTAGLPPSLPFLGYLS